MFTALLLAVALDTWRISDASALVARWCDALEARQIVAMDDCRLKGAIVCPACGLLHGRICDLVYPFVYSFVTTGEKRHLEAACRAVEWTERMMRRADGAVYNDYKSGWWPTCTFAQIALGKTLRCFGDRLPTELRASWLAIFRRETAAIEKGFGEGKFLAGVNVNYPAAYCEAMALAGVLLNDPSRLEAARKMADRLRGQFLEDGLFMGEGHPMDQRSPRGRRYIDLGYNLEETLPALLAYSELAGDIEMERCVIRAAEAHLEFLLPDGGLDNSCGSRSAKWTYYGSRTSDGMGALLGELAKRRVPWAVRALDRHLKLLRRCTTADELLAGGLAYDDADEPACVHQSFTHVKSLVDLLLLESVPVQAPATLLPREAEYGLRRFDSMGVALAAVGPWRATFSANDAFMGSEILNVTGGGPSLLWHEKVGPLLVGTMAEYGYVERTNMQDQRHERTTLTMTPRFVRGGFASATDGKSEMEATGDSSRVRVKASGRLTDVKGQSDAVYELMCEVLPETFLIRGSCAEDTEFHLPVAALRSDVVRVESRKVSILKEGTEVRIESNLPFELVTTDRGERAFSPICGLSFAYLKAKVPSGFKVEIRLTVEPR